MMRLNNQIKFDINVTNDLINRFEMQILQFENLNDDIRRLHFAR